MAACSSEGWFSGLASLFLPALLILFGVGVEEDTPFFLLTFALVGGILKSKSNKLGRTLNTHVSPRAGSGRSEEMCMGLAVGKLQALAK